MKKTKSIFQGYIRYFLCVIFVLFINIGCTSNNFNFTVDVLDQNGDPVSDAKIVIKVQGRSFTGATGDNGTAVISIDTSYENTQGKLTITTSGYNQSKEDAYLHENISYPVYLSPFSAPPSTPSPPPTNTVLVSPTSFTPTDTPIPISDTPTPESTTPSPTATTIPTETPTSVPTPKTINPSIFIDGVVAETEYIVTVNDWGKVQILENNKPQVHDVTCTWAVYYETPPILLENNGDCHIQLTEYKFVERANRILLTVLVEGQDVISTTKSVIIQLENSSQ
ncbi:hypothetical protein QUF64_08930 [Anaerolineales bacterium HSG6]|nr:hypothetical protein [Anaerolineales bacterium HSG6]